MLVRRSAAVTWAAPARDGTDEEDTYVPAETESASDTRERIQAVALELFTLQGFEKTSLREIAERLGVTKAALYYHFPSKTELIRSLVTPMVDDIDVLLEDAEAAETVVPRQLFESTFDMLHRHQAVFQALMTDASGFAHMDLERRTMRWIEEIQNALVGKDAEPAQRVRAVVAFAGVSRAAAVPAQLGLSVEEVRGPAIDAACAALGIEDTEA